MLQVYFHQNTSSCGFMPDFNENLADKYAFNSGIPSIALSNAESTVFCSSFFSCGSTFFSCIQKTNTNTKIKQLSIVFSRIKLDHTKLRVLTITREQRVHLFSPIYIYTKTWNFFSKVNAKTISNQDHNNAIPFLV